jgi:hypothetical protein
MDVGVAEGGSPGRMMAIFGKNPYVRVFEHLDIIDFLSKVAKMAKKTIAEGGWPSLATLPGTANAEE